MKAVTVVYKPVGLLVGIAGGMLAGAVFSQVWKLVAHEDDAPDMMDEERGWGEVLASAALHGAIFAVVKGTVTRAGATGIRRLTGTWPKG
ncbi:Protein of unknown function [Streptomyces sp. DvalAA-14]|uniref:DUF4235 domain-containing protein n=1 Tax=unclassified Streptomyces TaxID=2593676 RepID=UPI00081B2AFD|nr:MULTISPECIES: DUF4235 domain-containing protein [unclassified Streptomyces]MYS23902.1 DUF4235 domain-containing protein [Streptomyces sp. SID4948]SCE40141.1 Protein of unknown function [Streptomyces sp. DvalAA-14]